MLQLYICSHHQAACRTFNKRNIKYNTVKLWGPDLFVTLIYIYTKNKNKKIKDFL
jgi:hypothetical protein